MPGCATSAAPTVAPSPGQQVRAGRRIEARRAWNRRTASAAISGVCSAGLASTALPAASAAAIWPVKIASGKFHGLMQANTPRPCSASWLVSPTGPVSVSGPRELALGQHGVVAAEVGRLAHLGDAVGQRLAGLARAACATSRSRVGLQRIGHGAQHLGAAGAAQRVPAPAGPRGRRRRRRRHRLAWRCATCADHHARGRPGWSRALALARRVSLPPTIGPGVELRRRAGDGGGEPRRARAAHGRSRGRASSAAPAP